MSFRGPKSVKLYHNGELCAELESVKATVDLLVLHDPKHRSWSRVKYMFKESRKNNTELFGFTFVEDQSWTSSRAVSATDVETGETFVKDSVGEMSRVIFGPDLNEATSRISELCKNGKAHRGLVFNYVNENDDYSGYGNGGDYDRKAVQQLDIVTGNIINEFPSITHTVYYIWELGLSSASSVTNIRGSISQCLNGGDSKYNGIYLGYRWRFKP